ncbi:MAG: hypothetical protein WA792_09515 [Pseudolabrys sp.]
MSVEVAARFFGAGGFEFCRRFWAAVGQPIFGRAQILLLPNGAFAGSTKIDNVCHYLSSSVAAPVEPDSICVARSRINRWEATRSLATRGKEMLRRFDNAKARRIIQ